ncbi:hypothetical protein DFH06DRAFT_1299277 [Mycena polygramma]|nr:hypothetical protein DFH06DRAFT_1299277 [Mycena polygramma]
MSPILLARAVGATAGPSDTVSAVPALPSSTSSSGDNADSPDFPIWAGPVGFIFIGIIIVIFFYELSRKMQRSKNPSKPEKSTVSTKAAIAPPPPAYSAGSEDQSLHTMGVDTLKNQYWHSLEFSEKPPVAVVLLPPVARPAGAWVECVRPYA